MITKLRFWLFGKSKVLLAFEYGVILAETAARQGVPVTSNLMEKAELMIAQEFSTRTVGELANDMVPNVLSAFELDLSK